MVKLLEAINEDFIPHIHHNFFFKGKKACESCVTATHEPEAIITCGAKQTVSPAINPTSNSNPSTRGRLKKQARSRTVGSSTKGKTICGKGSGDDHLALPCKCRLVSKDYENYSFSMVKVVYLKLSWAVDSWNMGKWNKVKKNVKRKIQTENMFV